MANIYWCNEGTDLEGLYIVEDSRNKARLRYSAETNANYLDINAHIMKKDVEELPQTIDSCESAIIDKYDLPTGCDYCDYSGECEWRRDKRP